MFKLFYLVSLILNAYAWPVPYERLQSRPVNDPYCQALVPFCPTGKTRNPLPVMNDTDVIEVFALKKPVWQSKIGPLLKTFNIWHDGIGFRNTITGLEYTMEWYELDQLLNSTFPHLINNDSMLWCNQGALCSFDGIDRNDWSTNGIFEKVAVITGRGFNQFTKWASVDNNTAVFYETWTVSDTDDLSKQTVWFDSFDCANWVLRAFDTMYSYGAEFNHSIKLNYTRLNLYASEPKLLGNYTEIMNEPSLKNYVLDFYYIFQKRTDYVTQIISILSQFYLQENFILYYNRLYWNITLTKPYVKFTYDYVPLPGSQAKKNIY